MFLISVALTRLQPLRLILNYLCIFDVISTSLSNSLHFENHIELMVSQLGYQTVTRLIRKVLSEISSFGMPLYFRVNHLLATSLYS